MGNNGCNGLCEKTQVLQQFDDQFLPTQTLIPCQICNVHLDQTRFKQHIDHDHYCSIFQNKDGIVNAKCLLCDNLANNLEQQSQHINQKHPFAKTNKKPHDQRSGIITNEQSVKGPVELYKNKKQRVKKLLSERDFQILSSQIDHMIETSIKGEKYEAEVKTKEYRGLQFQQHLAEGELIWFKIFNSSKEYQYYYLDVDPKDRTIVCKAYIFSHSP